jgi:hypothetical protein
MRISNRFEKHIVAAATVAMSTAATANAAVVTWNCNLIIPFTNEGLYINVQDQTYASDSDNIAAGWDLNPYGIEIARLLWYNGGTSSLNGCVSGPGQLGNLGPVVSLSAGTVVGFGLTFGGTDSSVTDGGWVRNAANNFGFRFVAADGLIHYGYGVMTVGATMGVRTLTSVFYESVAATSITIPAPGALAVLGLAGFASRRRRA